MKHPESPGESPAPLRGVCASLGLLSRSQAVPLISYAVSQPPTPSHNKQQLVELGGMSGFDCIFLNANLESLRNTNLKGYY